jgi:hypothetical protein
MVTAANTETKAPAAMPSAERIQVEAMLSEGGGVSTFTADPPLRFFLEAIARDARFVVH